ncbi:signal-induced proliferation-associated 1-like protein 2 isoform X2 [Clupea harengus]|uniref:Signal-induced proliferation-associated 1-like protein 2 isoform X2 n=1 Tax=Clupea harengus TaxID=7950 RepID=A0A6P8F5Q2_CLUHA|nr:signal-induced proliferation-associated 1-like protein 2 isoform X2 [Clupea harengus]
MQTDNLFNKKLQALNGNMGPPITSSQGAPAMPKMGVRARVSDWPTRKEIADNCPPPRYDSLMTSFPSILPNQAPDGSMNPTQASLINANFLEAKYGLADLLNSSPYKGGFNPLRQRSNSDVTISDIGAEDVDQTAINPNTGASLHREYGSTSSLDRQSISGFSRPQNPDLGAPCELPSAPPPQALPELLHYTAPTAVTTTLSPSLQTATQIARGDIICISNLDYVDPSLFYSRERERSMLQRQKSEKNETSGIFRRLRTMKSDGDRQKQSTEQDEVARLLGRPQSFQKCFAHHDVPSVLFNISEAVANRANLARRKNVTTGASAASQHQGGIVGGGSGGGSSDGSSDPLPSCESPLGSCEDLGQRMGTDADEGDGKGNGMLLSCPYFRNETGGEIERKLGVPRANSATYSDGEDGYSLEASINSHCSNAGVSVLEVTRENYPLQREMVKRYNFEHVDQGAYYYQKYFYNKEHQNYFGVDENLGPVALSIRRERLEDSRDGAQYNYRIIFRTSELTTLRGGVLEDAVPSTAKHGTTRGLPLKEVLEYVVPELNISCLRLANSSPKVPDQLLKLDQQGLSFQHKVGVLYCKAGQSTEEEMYNNESGGPALEEFLDLLGQRVRLKGFTKYRAQLDHKTDSTGTHSLYTAYKDYELMFHVSTMLPHTPNNRQQLLRKRHIGNDIVTIIFQEPGALPFTPKNIRSHFQHVFIIVRAHSPCTENVSYSVSVSRSKDVPAFGPPIPKGVTFPKSAVFRDFLLTKAINAENSAHKSDKFRAMASRTRQEYLKDLAENFSGSTPVDSAGGSGAKFSFITLGARRKERSRPRVNAHLQSSGAITWAVVARDNDAGPVPGPCPIGSPVSPGDSSCLLAISNEFVALIEEASKEVVFNCYCRDVIGWGSSLLGRMKVYHERGACLAFSMQDGCGEEVREIAHRLEIVTRGCETAEMTLRRNAVGQLGFHVNFEGVVADVEPFGFAWQAGLRQGCRLVEICKVTVAMLSHEQMIDLLRTCSTVTVVVVHPHEDGTPRRGCSELYRSLPLVEYKLDGEGAPLRATTVGTLGGAGWHRVPMTQQLSRTSPTQAPSPGQQQRFHYAQAAISRSTSFDKKFQDGQRVIQDFDVSQPTVGSREPGQMYCSSPSNQSTSSDPGPCVSWGPKGSYDGSQSPALHDQPEEQEGECGREREPKLERTRSAEAKWHLPSTKILNPGLQRQGAKDSSRKFPRVRDKNCPSQCSSHSSSNTLSSNTSSGSSSDGGGGAGGVGKHFGSGDPMDPESLGLTYIKGASTDSGIDTAPCMPPPPPPLPLAGVGVGGGGGGGLRGVTRDGLRVESSLPWTVEYQEEGEGEDGDGDGDKLYLPPQGYAHTPSTASTGPVSNGSTGDLSEISSLSSGSRHSGSPSERGMKSSGSMDSSSKLYIISPTGSAPDAHVLPYQHSQHQRDRDKYLMGWKKAQEAAILDQEQARRMYLTDPACPAPEGKQHLSKEEFLRMLLPDSPPGPGGRVKATAVGQSPHRTLYRTLSDESLCSSHRRALSLASSRSSMLDQALPADILFGHTAPYHSTLPPRMTLRMADGQLKNDLWYSDGSLADKAKLAEAGLMPLPDPVGGLDWSHLVNAARAFEDQSAPSLSSLGEAEQAKQALEMSSSELSHGPHTRGGPALETGDGSPTLLTGKVNQLEVILRQLQNDLRKEQQDKAMLQEQVQHLRQDNMRLHEESQTSAAQLRRFTEWFLNSMDKTP